KAFILNPSLYLSPEAFLYAQNRGRTDGTFRWFNRAKFNKFASCWRKIIRKVCDTKKIFIDSFIRTVQELNPPAFSFLIEALHSSLETNWCARRCGGRIV